MKRLMLFLAAAVLLAGCTALPSGGDDDRPKRLEISGPTCTVNGQPCSSTQLTEFDRPRVSMTVTNNGESGVEVMLEEEGDQAPDPDGSSVMVSDCNIYELAGEGFVAKEKSLSAVEEVSGSESVILGEEEELEMIWNLELADVDVSRLGYTCPLGFALTLDQTLETERQVQVKERDDLPDVSRLQTSTSSKWPVRLRIESEQHVVSPDDENRSFVARAYLVNQGGGEVRSIGRENTPEELLAQADSPAADISLEFSQEGAGAECTEKADIGMYGAGEREGQSFREVCSFIPGDVENSEVHRLTARTVYRYRIDLPSVELSVVPVEGGG